ncbi:tyrosinase family oxidase copper chaperone [Streptomyces sp. NPDC048550]|uniref:apotyrosinase chaperone MelC1 n=1 Tax=unclassified Streptomyces TaxID=2593676 RepID=UPI002259049B|nr:MULTISPECIES: tyrosinase family oxidase copper chaperone [unclassified Streptomyces]MCX5149695.1 tyrosinase cofactor [Streptomyces sp. NBC_00320]WSN52734.1 tyrosinase family oxidase copper chaperone [Streptomyces sp. NBC_01296]WSW57757.1 tyrosinase cofactor [Streptomyces sp. NBC_00998]
MKKITRRQALGTAVGAVTAVGLTVAVIHASGTSSSGGDPKGADAASSPGPIPTGTIDEVYEGRRIQITFGEGDHQGGHHSPGLPTVRIDGNELHVMRNADGSWVSVVNHYETFPDPVTVVRAAVRDLRGAALAAFGPTGGTA